MTFYKVLGIPQAASAEEIRHRYRQLALQHHPDKNHGTDDKRFKEIQEAYATLSDPLKRSIYDQTIDRGMNLNSDDWKKYISTMFDYFMCMLMTTMNQPRDVHINLNVTLEDLYYHKVKKINVRVKRRGSDSMAFHNEIIPIYISLLNYETKYVFKGLGDDGMFQHIPRSDIVVKVEIESHNNINIDSIVSKYDLFIEQKVSLHDYFFRNSFCFETLGGESIDVQYETGKRVEVVTGKGLPYMDVTSNDHSVMQGNLYIYFDLLVDNDAITSMCNDDREIFQSFLSKYFSEAQKHID